jgi:hypothetical protein
VLVCSISHRNSAVGWPSPAGEARQKMFREGVWAPGRSCAQHPVPSAADPTKMSVKAAERCKVYLPKRHDRSN